MARRRDSPNRTWTFPRRSPRSINEVGAFFSARRLAAVSAGASAGFWIYFWVSISGGNREANALALVAVATGLVTAETGVSISMLRVSEL